MSVQLRARAAMAELAIGMLKFDPNQPRGADGRWIKGGAGAAPSAPAAPKPRARRASAKKAAPPAKAKPSASGWLDAISSGDGDSEAVRKQMRQMVEFKDPATGMSAHLDSVISNRNAERPAYVITVSIRDDQDRQVGQATRTIQPSQGDPSKAEIDHTTFIMGKRVQGGGFSSRWLKQLEEQYREAGIDRITLSTTDVGGYAWAKAGFDFVRDSDAAAMADRLAMEAEFGPDATPELRAVADDLKRRVGAGGDQRPTPMEIAMAGWTPGAETWAGKRTMLGQNWKGVKEL